MVHIDSSSFEKTILNRLLLWELGWIDKGFLLSVYAAVCRESEMHKRTIK